MYTAIMVIIVMYGHAPKIQPVNYANMDACVAAKRKIEVDLSAKYGVQYSVTCSPEQ